MKSKYIQDSGMYWGSKFVTNECYGEYWAKLLLSNRERLVSGYCKDNWLKVEELFLIATEVLEEVLNGR